jgi:hypothetical protein
MTERGTQEKPRGASVRGAVLLVALVAAAVMAASAAAAGTGKNPLSLVLQRADFPAKATWSAGRFPEFDKALAAVGLRGKSADYAAEIPLGSTGTLRVSGQVVVFEGAADARRWFARQKRDLVQSSRLGKTVRLPAYGDEQVAVAQLEPKADLRVRRGTVVWSVEVILRGSGYTSAQALVQLRAYATKLKRRVGSG